MTFFKNLNANNLVLIGVLVAATVLRLWQLPETLQFLGDQGRDAIIAKHILKDGDLVLIGPVTSTGNMYLGPLYYYFMVPFLGLSYPSPLGPAYAVAVLSILSVAMLYFVTKQMFDQKVALFSTTFLAFSAVAITYSRFSWNPNLAPLFSIVLIWASYKFLTKNPWYMLIMAACISVLIQLHYVTLLTIPAAGCIWLVGLWKNFQQKPGSWKKHWLFIGITVASCGIFAASLLPLVLFDVRHGYINVQALQTFLQQDQGNLVHAGSAAKLAKIVKESHGRSLLVLAEMYLGKQRLLNSIFIVFLLGAFLFSWRKALSEPTRSAHITLGLYLFWGIVGLSFYQSSVFPHYVAYLYPVTVLMYGIVCACLWTHRLWGKMIALSFSCVFLVWNMTHLPFKPLGWNVYDIEQTTKTILDRVQPGEKYNLVLLTGTGDIEAMNYRYFLETTHKKPLPKDQFGQTETLFIINEDKKLAKVTDSPIYEIVVFPNKNPAEVYTIPDGPEITVLKR